MHTLIERGPAMSSTQARRQRADEANKVVDAIASYGLHRFYDMRGDRVARFSVGVTGHIYFTDETSGARVYITKDGQWAGITSTGPMLDLIRALRDYIRDARPLFRSHFGPWPSCVGNNDPWGYGEAAMDSVRKAVFNTKAVRL